MVDLGRFPQKLWLKVAAGRWISSYTLVRGLWIAGNVGILVKDLKLSHFSWLRSSDLKVFQMTSIFWLVALHSSLFFSCVDAFITGSFFSPSKKATQQPFPVLLFGTLSGINWYGEVS